MIMSFSFVFSIFSFFFVKKIHERENQIELKQKNLYNVLNFMLKLDWCFRCIQLALLFIFVLER